MQVRIHASHLAFNLSVFTSECLQGRGSSAGHSWMEPPLGQRITGGLPGRSHTNIWTHSESRSLGVRTLALNYISWHDRSRRRGELLFHFRSDGGVKSPFGFNSTLLCSVSITLKTYGLPWKLPLQHCPNKANGGGVSNGPYGIQLFLEYRIVVRVERNCLQILFFVLFFPIRLLHLFLFIYLFLYHFSSLWAQFQHLIWSLCLLQPGSYRWNKRWDTVNV